MLARPDGSPPRTRPRPLARLAVGTLLAGAIFCLQLACAPSWAAAQVQPRPTLGATDPSLAVTPGWEGAPWEPKVQTILNVTAQVSLACCVLAFLLGGAAMGVGRIVGSYQSGTRGLQFVLGGAGGALVITSAPSVVSWLIK